MLKSIPAGCGQPFKILHTFTPCGRHSHEAHHPSRRTCGSCKCSEFFSAYGCVVCESRQVWVSGGKLWRSVRATCMLCVPC